MANLNLIPFPTRTNFFCGLVSRQIYLHYLKMLKEMMHFFFHFFFCVQMKSFSDYRTLRINFRKINIYCIILHHNANLKLVHSHN